MTENNNRINEQNVVSGSQVVLDINHPDLVFVNPKHVLLSKNGAILYDKYITTTTDLADDIESGAVVIDIIDDNNTDTTIIDSDVPELTDIEGLPIYEQYYDPVSKLVKYKVTLKIRNSSKNKTNVVGVDARIYNPSGI